MEIVLGVLLLCFLSFVALVVVGVRAAQRGVRRISGQARRTVSDVSLRAKATQPGASGELARLRRDLRASLDSTRAVLIAGSADDPALREALSLLDQLHGHARHLDGELGALMDSEPDRARIAERLPDLRRRTEKIRGSADALRTSALDRAHRYDAGELDSLHQQIDIEAQALRHWSPAETIDPGSGDQPRGQLPQEPQRRQLFRRKPQSDPS